MLQLENSIAMQEKTLFTFVWIVMLSKPCLSETSKLIFFTVIFNFPDQKVMLISAYCDLLTNQKINKFHPHWVSKETGSEFEPKFIGWCALINILFLFKACFIKPECRSWWQRKSDEFFLKRVIYWLYVNKLKTFSLAS